MSRAEATTPHTSPIIMNRGKARQIFFGLRGFFEPPTLAAMVVTERPRAQLQGADGTWRPRIPGTLGSSGSAGTSGAVVAIRDSSGCQGWMRDLLLARVWEGTSPNCA